ncbi:MAPEG family protein, partial [bacterium]|nr:MAPEG family protein [bacterium]
WEIKFRIQQNTLEQLIVFIPSMLTFSYYVSASWVLLPGVLFLLGRQIYSSLYLKDPKIRGPGAVMSIFSNIALVIGSLIGLGLHIVG